MEQREVSELNGKSLEQTVQELSAKDRAELWRHLDQKKQRTSGQQLWKFLDKDSRFYLFFELSKSERSRLLNDRLSAEERRNLWDNTSLFGRNYLWEALAASERLALIHELLPDLSAKNVRARYIFWKTLPEVAKEGLWTLFSEQEIKDFFAPMSTVEKENFYRLIHLVSSQSVVVRLRKLLA